jgi:4a-hydroxytetrahydrobiopterin dehydratase
MARLLDSEEVARQLEGLPGWTGSTAEIRRSYTFPSFPTCISAVDEIAVLAEDMDHHPDLDIRWRTLHVVLSTHSEGGTTQLDIELAHQLHEAAARLGGT